MEYPEIIIRRTDAPIPLRGVEFEVCVDGLRTGPCNIGEVLETIIGLWMAGNPGVKPGLGYLNDEVYWERSANRKERMKESVAQQMEGTI